MNEKIKSSSGSIGGGAGPGGGGGIAINSGSGVTGGNSTSAQSGGSPAASGGAGVGLALSHNASDGQQILPPPHPYGPPGGSDAALMAHYLHQQAQPHAQHMPPHSSQSIAGAAAGPHTNSGEHPNKDDYGQNVIGSGGGSPVSVPSGHHPMYGRYHHTDPSMDPYRYSHGPIQQQPPLTATGKPQQSIMSVGGGSGGISSPSRPPPQRYIPGQPPQGPTPTLNSLLQSSHPSPHPQHRYTNSYDVSPQQQQSQQTSQSNVGSQQQPQQQQHQQPQQQSHGGPPPPPPHQQHPYGQQGGWAPPPRPYSPQLSLSQQYRGPPMTNSSRGQSPYAPTHGGPNSGSYPNSPQQAQQQQQQQQGGPGSSTTVGASSVGPPPPPPQSSNQGTTPSQYAPYPHRYPTPPGSVTGPTHRTAYSTHQYPEPNRPWPGSSSPAPSQAPGSHPLPPASPHHGQHIGPPPSSSPSHAPSPSPQPSQASPSPHQELISQNSNDSSSGGGHSGTPNSQQVMRPTPSPTGSSGSRSMSPAVAQNHQISRPSSNQSSSGPMQQPGIGGPQGALPSGQGPPQQNAGGNMPSQQGPPGSNTSVGGQPGTQQLPSHNQSMSNMPPQPQLTQTSGGPSVYPLPPHMHGGYKITGPNSGPQGLLTGYPPPPPQQAQQYSQGSYPPRPQYPPNSYASAPPTSNQPSSVNNMPPNSGSQQYSGGRPIPNHGGPSPYPPYQSWVPQAGQLGALTPGASGAPPGNHIQGKGTPPPPQSAGSPRPVNYLKQHLQHKGGYVPGSVPQGYGNGPGMHPGGMPMGPPHHMGPPHGPINMGPPTSTSSQSIMSSIPPGAVVGETTGGPPPPSDHISQDNGISSSGSSNSAPGAPHPVTSVVTTGPDGTTMDEVSQQSSLSNASAASGEDPQCTTPKSRKSDLYGQGHLAPPSTSPGSLAGVGPHQGGGPVDDYEMSSPPNWARTPASPSFNSHVPQPDAFRNVGGPVTPVSVCAVNKKSDSLCKLYEMDENPERRLWLDKLRAFMDERRTPITACPTISKQPLDLFRLYLYVKERGGFVEVCKVTKSKTWKDIAGLLGIGASSSAAYTLRKHYTKNLLAFECHYDRGDIDPLPIIQQVEAGTKKKATKAASVPSPAGSSNSQDSFPAPGSGANNPMDGYPPYSGAYSSGGPQADYAASGPMSRPPSQNNTQNPHSAQSIGGGSNLSAGNPFEDQVGGAGASGSNSNVGVDGAVGSGTISSCTTSTVNNNNNSNNNNNGPLALPSPSPTIRLPYHAAGGSYPPPIPRTSGSPYPTQPGSYGQYVSNDQYNAAPGAPPAPFSQQQGQFPPQNRNMYPPYGTEGEASPTGSNQYGPYGNRPYSQPPPTNSQTPTPPGAPSNAAGSVTGAGSAATTTSPYSSGQQDYYRPPDQNPQPRRHPDFVKDTQSYLGYSTRPQIYGGWQGAAANQYRNQYPSSPSAQSWVAAPPPPRTATPTGSPLVPGQQTSAPVTVAQWEQQHRYPSQQQSIMPTQQAPYQQQQQPNQQQPAPPPQWAQMGTPASTAVVGPTVSGGGAPGCSLRPPIPQQQQRMASSTGSCIPGAHAPPPQGPAVVGAQSTVSNSGSSGGPSTGSGTITGNVGGPVSGGSSMVSKTPFSMPPPQATVNTVPVGPTIIPGVINGPQKTIAPPVGPPSVAPVQQSAAPPAPFIQLAKKEIVFPPDSVEATTPVLYRRKRLTKVDVCPVDPWRLFMAMRSGLLTECTWALDILNVLLFDDATVQYFGLAHLPGLLTLLLEHFQKALSEMFTDEAEETYCKNGNVKRKFCNSVPRKAQHHELNSKMDNENMDDIKEIDLGQVKELPNPEERVVILTQTPNYTMMSRKGLPVRLQPAENDIFVTSNLKTWDAENTSHNFEETTPLACNAWTYGYTEQNSGIIDVFKSEIIDIPFARYIKTGKGRVNSDNKYPKSKIENEKTAHSSSKADLMESERDAEFEWRVQQNVFNKKRRLFNNSTTPTKLDPFKAKKLKFQINDGKEEEEEENSKKNVQSANSKRDDRANNTDSDCREIDMELETIGGGITKEVIANIDRKIFDPKATARDPALVLERRRSCSNLEDECYTRDESSLYLVNESQDSLARRCICISNIFRNLSFVPGNETILAKSPRFLAVLGRLLLLYHEHLPRPPKNRNYDRGFEEDYDFSDSCSSLHGEQEWWWDYLISIRENMLVIIANIAGHLELTRYEELIARPLIDGLLHWAVCPSSHGQDPFPSCGPTTLLSPQRLALEALCKLCVTDNNVDLVIATPPFSRLEKLCAVLTRHLCRNEDQVLREFSVNLLHYLAAADSAMSRTVAMQSPCISYLVAFIEQAEQTALGVANQHGINYLRENPDSMGTSLDMLRRAAGTLLHLAKHPDNRSLFMQQEQRLLGLVMSHILDQQVALIISRVLYQVSRGPGTTSNSLEYRLQQKQQLKNENNDKKALNRDLGKIELADTNVGATSVVSSNICDNNNTASVNTINANNKVVLQSTSTSTIMASADSENSNSSCQTSSATAAFNDVSNSSTNSNSCGTVASSHSNHSIGSGSTTNLSNMCNNTLNNNCTSISNSANLPNTNAVNFGQATKTLSNSSEHMKNNILTGVIAAAACNNKSNTTNSISRNNNNGNNDNNGNSNNNGDISSDNIPKLLSSTPATSGLTIVAPPPSQLPPPNASTTAAVSSATTASTTTTTTAAVA